MKRLRYVCLLFIVIACYEANGQIEKGTRFWGGDDRKLGKLFFLKSGTANPENSI